jgi:U3 small nucleolar RNA-associated protein 14
MIDSITPDEAVERGLKVLAGPYSKSQRPMARRVMDDMQSGKIPAAYVTTRDGLEVWRSTIGFFQTAK